MKASIAAKIANARDRYEPQVNRCSTERHFRPEEVAEIWGVDTTTVRRVFRDVPGVLKLGRITARGSRREYVKLRIPQSILDKVHSEMTR